MRKPFFWKFSRKYPRSTIIHNFFLLWLTLNIQRYLYSEEICFHCFLYLCYWNDNELPFVLIKRQFIVFIEIVIFLKDCQIYAQNSLIYFNKSLFIPPKRFSSEHFASSVFTFNRPNNSDWEIRMRTNAGVIDIFGMSRQFFVVTLLAISISIAVLFWF